MIEQVNGFITPMKGWDAVEQKQYLLATGQLEDAHSLPIAQAKAELSLEVMISLRNKAMEAYNEILKMSV